MDDFSSVSMHATTLEEKVRHLTQRFRVSEEEALKLLHQHGGDLEKLLEELNSTNQQPGSASEAESVASCDMARPAGDGGPLFAIDSATGTQQDPIDLTKDSGDQDMQKALMLSMQDLQSTSGAVVSLEEQELSRALEASLRESNVNMSKPMLALFQDPKNPHKRKRIGQTPVGLKNIGNTCWFSAVIQSLYHIPAFQREILSYVPPPLPNGDAHHPQCVTFVLELQKLFTLLLKSNKMYIDPSRAIQSLQEAFSKEHSHAGAQQDVSEFTHKLLEWIENAFKLSLDAVGEGDNPIVKLFNGHYRTEGINNDEPFLTESDFGAYPLQVRGHSHLHESLESATFDTEMNQQTFFTRFPPILVLELSRFQYNQATKQAEKVHDKLKFDLQLYVDRYLEENKLESCQRKIEVDRLRKKIKELEGRLDWYIHYQQRPLSITDILSLTLSFVREEGGWEQEEGNGEGPSGEEQGAEKRARTSLHPSPRYKSESELQTLEECLTRWSQELSQDMEELQSSILASKATLNAVYNDPMMNKTSYYLHAVMVHQGEASGGHYWAYTRKHPTLTIPALSDRSQDSDGGSMDGAASSSEGSSSGEKAKMCTSTPTIPSSQFGKTNFRTQLETGEVCSDVAQSPESMSDVASASSPSVLGGMSAFGSCNTGVGGISRTGGGEGMEVEREETGSVWTKFNDVSVSEVGWEEVRRESFGGANSNTSAYCLVYVDRDLHYDWLNDAAIPRLNQDLLKYVSDSNEAFLKELIDHDKNIQTAGHITSDVTVASEGCPPSPLGVVMSPVASGLSAAAPENALPAGPRQGNRSPQELMQIDSPPVAPPISPTLQNQLTKLVSAHNFRTQQLIKQYDEPRPLNPSAFATYHDYPKSMLRLLALQDIALNQREDTVKMLANKEYMHDLSRVVHTGGSNPMLTLKRTYQNFVTVCWFFVQAMKMALDSNFTETLMLCLRASHLHRSIRSRGEASLQSRHLSLLNSLKCRALQEVSSKAYSMFEQGEVRDGIQIANTLVVPALAQLSRDGGREGEEVLEKVREEWCQCLNRPGLNEGEQDQLGDLLTRILDDSGKIPSLPDFGSSGVELDSLNTHTLVNDFHSCVTRLLALQQNRTDSFLGI